MNKTYWTKAWQDLRQNCLRALLVFLSIATATLALTTVSDSYLVLSREMNASFLGTNPASATLWFRPNTNKDIVAVLKQIPEVEQAELRKVVEGRIEVAPHEWQSLILFVVHDFEHLQINRFYQESGQTVPRKGEILIERSSVSVTRTSEGNLLKVLAEGSEPAYLNWAGTVYDPAQAPGWMHGEVFGYIQPSTLEILGLPTIENAVKLTLKKSLDQKGARERLVVVRNHLEKAGIDIVRSIVPPPATHPHDRQIRAILTILLLFSIIVLILSGIVIANMMNGFMTRQVRQVGIMKSIGGRPRQIVFLYTLFVLSIVVVAVPLGWVGSSPISRSFMAFVSGQLNFNIQNAQAPFWLSMFQIAFCLFVPIAFGMYPVIKASQKSVLDTLNDQGLKLNLSQAFAPKIGQLISRPLLLTLRNTFRKKARFWLTMGSLALGGAAFVASFNVRASWQKTIAEVESKQRYDLDIQLYEPVEISQMDSLLQLVPTVENYESWAAAKVFVKYPDESESLRFEISGMPEQPQFYTPTIEEGRALAVNSSKNEVVATRSLIFLEPELRVGDSILLMLHQQPTYWHLVGITYEADAAPAFYTYKKSVERQLGLDENKAAHFRINTTAKTDEARVSTLIKLEKLLVTNGIAPRLTKEAHVLEQNFKDHFVIIVNMLLAIAAILALVGFLGLSSTLSMNVLERTREFGIMQAIGATQQQVSTIILSEGLIIGVLSWVLAVLIALPVSFGMGTAIGNVGLLKPLAFVISWEAVFGWLILLLICTVLVGLIPVFQARRTSVRDALMWE